MMHKITRIGTAGIEDVISRLGYDQMYNNIAHGNAVQICSISANVIVVRGFLLF